MLTEDEFLLMSGIQHFDFCRRQWALIHIEQQWCENVLTAEGRIDHKRCHDEGIREKRGDKITIRGMRVISHKLQLTGTCDVVEFLSDENGIALDRYDGKWRPFPVEYKHGTTKTIDADRMQLCAQAMALEEMFVCDISKGYLFYEKDRRREEVILDDDLRSKTIRAARDMITVFLRGETPKIPKKSKCDKCSLMDYCIPEMNKRKTVSNYIEERILEI